VNSLNSLKPLNLFSPARQFHLPNLVWCFSALTLVAAVSATSQAQSFQWKLATGDAFDVQVTEESTTTTEFSKRTTVHKSVSSVMMRWKVLQSQGGDYLIEQVIASIATSSGNPAIPQHAFSVDTASEKKPTPQEAKLLSELRSLVGLSCLVKMDRTGKILSVEIPTETTSKLASLSDSSLAAAFTTEAIMNRMKSTTMIVPDKEWKPGESWKSATSSVSTEADDVLPIKYEYSGTETSDGKKLAVFKWTAEKPIADTENPAALDFKDFRQAGLLRMDVEAGYFVDSEMGSTVASERIVGGEKMRSKVESITKMLIRRINP